MNRIETSHKELYIKGGKSGSESVTLTSSLPITIEVVTYTNDLDGSVSYNINGNIITFTYSDLYLHGETYSGKIIATTSDDILEIPVIINCSDTLIYESHTVSVDPYKTTYHVSCKSLPVVNRVMVVNDSANYYKDMSHLINCDDASNKVSFDIVCGDFDYVLMSNGLSQISLDVERIPREFSIVSGGYRELSNEAQTFSVYVRSYYGDKSIAFNIETVSGDVVVKSITRVRNGLWELKFDIDANRSNDDKTSVLKLIQNVYLEELELTIVQLGGYVERNSKMTYSTDEREEILLWNNEYHDGFFPHVTINNIPYNYSTYTTDGGGLYVMDFYNDRTLYPRYSYLFKGCKNLKEVNVFDFSTGSFPWGMFDGCSILEKVPPVNIKDNSVNQGEGNNDEYAVDYMFRNCSSLTTVPSLDISWCISSIGLFDGCSSLTTVPSLDVSLIRRANYMFRNCSSLTTVPSLDFRNLKYRENSGMNAIGFATSIFEGCSSLTTVPYINLEYAEGLCDAFNGCKQLTNISMKTHSTATDKWGNLFPLVNTCLLERMFKGCESLNDLNSIYISGNTESMDTMGLYARIDNMFDGCKGLEHFHLKSIFPVTMKETFKGCTSLKDVDFEAMPIAESSILESYSHGAYTFDGCTSLENVSFNLEENVFDSGLLRDFTYMFNNCTSLKNVSIPIKKMYIDGSYMFNNCTSLETFDVKTPIYKYSGMFNNCTSLKNITHWEMKYDSNMVYEDLRLRDCDLLTHESLMNVINGLIPVDRTTFLSLGKNAAAKLTDDEISIATRKGWIISWA